MGTAPLMVGVLSEASRSWFSRPGLEVSMVRLESARDTSGRRDSRPETKPGRGSRSIPADRKSIWSTHAHTRTKIT